MQHAARLCTLTGEGSTGPHPVERPSAFRVMARLSDDSRALLSLARSRGDAVALAEQLFEVAMTHFSSAATRRPTPGRKPRARWNRHPCRSPSPTRISAIYIETWIGSMTEGRWRLLPSEHGGFFRWCRGERPNEERGVTSPRSGDTVECVLLPERTRKGGWLARLCDRDLRGPISNSKEVPPSVQPAELVRLRIEAINRDRTRIQFRWLHDSGRNPAVFA